jgi:hypothetical protein
MRCWAERIASVLVKGWNNKLDGWQESTCSITELLTGDASFVGDHLKQELLLIEVEKGEGGSVWGSAPQVDNTLHVSQMWMDWMKLKSGDCDLEVRFINFVTSKSSLILGPDFVCNSHGN